MRGLRQSTITDYVTSSLENESSHLMWLLRGVGGTERCSVPPRVARTNYHCVQVPTHPLFNATVPQMISRISSIVPVRKSQFEIISNWGKEYCKSPVRWYWHLVPVSTLPPCEYPGCGQGDTLSRSVSISKGVNLSCKLKTESKTICYAGKRYITQLQLYIFKKFKQFWKIEESCSARRPLWVEEPRLCLHLLLETYNQLSNLLGTVVTCKLVSLIWTAIVCTLLSTKMSSSFIAGSLCQQSLRLLKYRTCWWEQMRSWLTASSF